MTTTTHIATITELGARESDFRPDHRVGGFELLQDAAKVLFRLAITYCTAVSK
jgi:hypothetical protein